MGQELRVDQEIVCVQCGGGFVFSVGEQSYFAHRKLSPPKRCPVCREERRRSGTYGSQVVPVDSETDVVLCKRCSRQASNLASLRAGEALCRACAEGDETLPKTPEEDLLYYGDWADFYATKKKGN